MLGLQLVLARWCGGGAEGMRGCCCYLPWVAQWGRRNREGGEIAAAWRGKGTEGEGGVGLLLATGESTEEEGRWLPAAAGLLWRRERSSGGAMEEVLLTLICANTFECA